MSTLTRGLMSHQNAILPGVPREHIGRNSEGTNGAVATKNFQRRENDHTYPILFGFALKELCAEENSVEKVFLWAVLLPIAVLEILMIVIGTLYREDCPYQQMIPLYLIVKGSFVIINIFFHFLQQFIISELESNQARVRRALVFLINCFLAVWTTAGNTWILRFQRPVLNDVTSPLYCHVTLYRFAFVVTLIEDSLVLLGILGLVVKLLYEIMKVSRKTDILPIRYKFNFNNRINRLFNNSCNPSRQSNQEKTQEKIPTEVIEVDLD